MARACAPRCTWLPAVVTFRWPPPCSIAAQVLGVWGTPRFAARSICGKADVAALLLSRGADLHSVGSRGLTPLGAGRGALMQQLLRSYIDRVQDIIQF